MLSAERRSGLSKLVHEKARPVAFAWVALVTCFSLVTQAYALGLTGAQLAGQLGISPGVLVLTILPHAMPELVALFLPLAAWMIASRRNEWHDLLAATFATVGDRGPRPGRRRDLGDLRLAAPAGGGRAPRLSPAAGAYAMRLGVRRLGLAEQGAAEDPLLLVEEKAPEVVALEQGPALGLEDRAPGQRGDPLGERQ